MKMFLNERECCQKLNKENLRAEEITRHGNMRKFDVLH